MTARKKKGIGYWISGGVFLAVGTVLFALDTTPAWVNIALQAAGLLANLFRLRDGVSGHGGVT